MTTASPSKTADVPIEYYGKFCVYCGSTHIIFKDKPGKTKNGRRIRRRRYQCNDCGRKFRWGAFVKNKCGAKLVVQVLNDVADGLLFSVVAERAKISKATVAKMVTKFAPYLNAYEEYSSPRLGLVLQLDCMWSTLADDYSYIKLPDRKVIDALIENNQVAVTNVKDVANHFWTASAAGLDNSVTVYTAILRTLQVYKEKPREKITLVTDDHALYRKIVPLFPTFNHVFQSKKENIAVINSLENLNKTGARKIIPHHVRRFRTIDLMQKALDVRRFKCNFIHPQKSLNRRTPAEAAHCKPLWGKNKWLTAINIGYVETIKRRLDSFKSHKDIQNLSQTNTNRLCRSIDSKLDNYLDIRIV